MFLYQFGRDADDVLTLPVLDHVERLQRADDVTLCDAGHLAADGTEVRSFDVEMQYVMLDYVCNEQDVIPPLEVY